MRPLLLALLPVLAGCATTGVRIDADKAVLENDRLKIVFLAEGAGVSVKRDSGWLPVALLRGPRFTHATQVDASLPCVRFDDGIFTLKKNQLWFETTAEVSVEVRGERAMALFPGLEFLEGNEFSSSDRDAHGALADRRRPDPAKVTVPLMAYEVGPTLIALLWKDSAKPFFEAREKNLMGLFPADPKPEHARVAGVLHVEEPATIYDAVPRWTETFGLPQPEPWPRSIDEELALCKAGFATVGDPSGKSRHCVGWALEWAPGFGTLRHLMGEKVDWSRYPDLLSGANCHILRWEAPFYAGKPELVKNLVAPMKELAKRRVDGEWSFQPANQDQEKLGKRGDTVLGTSAVHALNLAKAARLTDDEELEYWAFETLRKLRKYKVPRGAQSWECPLYEPDILAAAYAVGAYVEAFKLSKDEKLLHDAVRWAKSGLPFLYLWSLPNRPGMLYGSIPVFGTTQYTHSWFGVPVQWNGLVYAYYLRKLAPLDKSFDWLCVADGITASAIHQQYADGPSKGCYPDGFYEQCTKRCPPDINPEDILVNVLTSIGKDPDPDLKWHR